MKISVLPQVFGVCRLSPEAEVPAWATGGLLSITRTPEELSIVCEERNIVEGVRFEGKWRALKVEGPLDFGLTGILASIANPLSQAKISIFALSTFDTDYVLVKMQDLVQATDALKIAGITIV